MKRQENQPGFLPVPLFNQRKRSRIPLTSLPCEKEFFSHNEYPVNTSLTAPHTGSGKYGSYQPLGDSSGVPESHQWSRQGIQQSAPPQQYGSNRPLPGPSLTTRPCTPMTDTYKAGESRYLPGKSVRQCDSRSGVDSKHSSYQGSRGNENSKSKPTYQTGTPQMAQLSFHKPPTSTHQYSQQSRALPSIHVPSRSPSARAAQPEKKSWKFTNSFEQQKSSFVGKTISNTLQTAQPAKSQLIKKSETPSVKPATENSLRILTAVIDGMRHWSQFKDKVPCLFEIFATLDSAVTLGQYGAKNFLMRDGKKVVQCVFYENEQMLPRLIRGQVHRCVGNYDRSRDALICMSVRPCLPSELRNAQEAVKICDAEMRALVKKLSEV